MKSIAMIPAEQAITRFRRGMTASAVVRAALTLGAAAALVAPVMGMGLGSGVPLLVLLGLWLLLSFRSARGSQMAASLHSLIASGEYERAERQIEHSLSTFSLFRSVKILSLHQLAVLRHAQARYRESAMLCRALLGQRLGPMSGVSKQSRLILADALLELNDIRGAYDAIAGLYGERLSLAEALNLLLIELDYEARLGAWDAMLFQLPTKIQLAEVMPTDNAARAQAYLALAAKKTGRAEVAIWLRRRVELLVETDKLIGERPVLGEVFVEKA